MDWKGKNGVEKLKVYSAIASKALLSLLVNKIICYKRESSQAIELAPKTSYFCKGAALCE